MEEQILALLSLSNSIEQALVDAYTAGQLSHKRKDNQSFKTWFKMYKLRLNWIINDRNESS